MYARYVQKGESIDYRPSETVAAGDVIIIADLIGIARLDIAPDTLGSLAVAGVFNVVKSVGEIANGLAVYWDVTTKQATTIAEGNIYLGKAIASAESADESVDVLINVPKSEAQGSAGTAITDLTDNSGGTAANTIPVLTDTDCQIATASLAAKTNQILAALRVAGIIETE